jgi:hypothetical protein
MSKRIKYDIKRLNQYCAENQVNLLEHYNDKPLTKNYIIKGNCIYDKCKNNFEKKFINLIGSGAYCDTCKNIILVEKMKKTFLQKYGAENILHLDFVKEKTNPDKFTYEKLMLYCNERNINLLDDYTHSHLTKKSSIKTKCQALDCNGVVEKVFREIEKRGAYCKACTQQNKTKKIKSTCLERYGAECPLVCDTIQNKMKQTNLNKYGVEHTFQNEIIKNKIKETCLKKYGVEKISQNKEVREKYKNTCLEKYGTEHYSQTEEYKEKYKASIIQKYGVEYLTQNSTIMDKITKSGYSRKEYIFPSGNIGQIQGYEHFALNDLIINEKIDESDIIIGAKNVPEIWYFDNGKKRRYYVDIYIPSQNKCIEVKSTYTYSRYEKNNLLKEEATKKLGYNFEFWIYNQKGEKLRRDML